MENEIELTIDLTPAELFVITMLASLGEAVMADDAESEAQVASMLIAEKGTEKIAKNALDKLYASLKLAKKIIQDYSTTVVS
jgi:hypothetical protein